MTLETSIRGKQLVPLASSSLRIEGPLKAGKQGFHRCHRSKRKTTVKASPATVSAFEAAAKASPLNYVRVWCQHIRFVHGYYCVYLLARLWIQYSVCELKFGWWFLKQCLHKGPLKNYWQIDKERLNSESFTKRSYYSYSMIMRYNKASEKETIYHFLFCC